MRGRGYQIRPATAADSQAAAEVVQAVYQEYGFTWDPAEYHADLYDLEAFYLQAGHRFWLADASGKMVGTVALEIFPALPGADPALIELEGFTRVAGSDCALQRLYVRSEARNLGVGTALMETVLSAAREMGRKRLEIWSDKRFETAHRLYFREGAVQVGDRICHDPDQSPEWGLYINL